MFGWEINLNFHITTPIFETDVNAYQKGINTLSQSYIHWGFLSWAILGALTSIILMHLHYDKNLPLKPKTFLHPIFGNRVYNPIFGGIIDGCCIIAVAAGTIDPIGFLGLQIGF